MHAKITIRVVSLLTPYFLTSAGSSSVGLGGISSTTSIFCLPGLAAFFVSSATTTTSSFFGFGGLCESFSS